MEKDETSKRLIFLQRQWELLEVHKKNQTQISYVSIFLILAITSSIINSKEFPNGGVQLALSISAILSICFLALLLLRHISIYYDNIAAKIKNMYVDLSMDYEKNWEERESNQFFGKKKILNTYVIVIIAITLICVATIATLPLAKP